MKSPNILSIERYPICRQPDVLTDGNAIIIPDSDCVKQENCKKDLELKYFPASISSGDFLLMVT